MTTATAPGKVLPGLQKVQTQDDDIDLVSVYEKILGADKINALKAKAKALKDIKVAHINATAYGGGVAELLHRQIPLMNQLGKQSGFHTDWFILHVDNPAFYDVTKKMHNTLQGAEGELTEADKALYKKTLQENFSNGLLDEYDVIFNHDPQPAGLIDLYPEHTNKWAWRCHIDTTTPNMPVWDFIRQFAVKHNAAIWTRQTFVQNNDQFKEVRIIPPSIDPLSLKNSDLTEKEISDVLVKFGINPNKPLMVQVSRFDPWKQPLEVIDIYQKLKKEFPDLQLLYAGSMATDDPEGMGYWEQCLRKAGEDKDVFIYNNYHGVGNVEINAFQRAADLLLQYSSKEGFGLTVSEGMWKYQPVIGGKVGGIQDQIVDKESGFLVSTDDEVIAICRDLLKNPEKRKAMGQAAHDRVAERFLITREVEDYMTLALDMLGRSV
ncbi:MAG: glycosyltransferase [Candidatus Melainabacteria bacterium]